MTERPDDKKHESSTPRTDALLHPGLDLADAHDIVDLCRQLERELAEAKELCALTEQRLIDATLRPSLATTGRDVWTYGHNGDGWWVGLDHINPSILIERGSREEVEGIVQDHNLSNERTLTAAFDSDADTVAVPRDAYEGFVRLAQKRLGFKDRGDITPARLIEVVRAVIAEAKAAPSPLAAPDLLAEARRLISLARPLSDEGTEGWLPWCLESRAWCAKVDAEQPSHTAAPGNKLIPLFGEQLSAIAPTQSAAKGALLFSMLQLRILNEGGVGTIESVKEGMERGSAWVQERLTEYGLTMAELKADLDAIYKASMAATDGSRSNG